MENIAFDTCKEHVAEGAEEPGSQYKKCSSS